MAVRHGWTIIHLSLIFGFSNVYHFACVWPTALKIGCISNFDVLFLVMEFISLSDKTQFMLISSRHICTRSKEFTFFARPHLPATIVARWLEEKEETAMQSIETLT